jgi:hypothetical protein
MAQAAVAQAARMAALRSGWRALRQEEVGGLATAEDVARLERAIGARLEALDAALAGRLQAHLLATAQAVGEIVTAERRQPGGGERAGLAGPGLWDES